MQHSHSRSFLASPFVQVSLSWLSGVAVGLNDDRFRWDRMDSVAGMVGQRREISSLNARVKS